MNRLGILFLAPVVGAALLAGCTSGSVESGISAFSIGGRDTSQRFVDQELEELAENEALQQFVEQPSQGGQPLVLSRSAGSIDSSLAAGWLSQMIALSAVQQQNDREGIDINGADRTRGRELAAQVVGGVDTFETFSDEFRDEVADRWSAAAAAQRQLLGDGSAGVDDALSQQCPSRRYASHILVATRAEAAQIRAELIDGADFAQLAQARSTDTGSAVQGGELGCIDGQQYVEPFATAVQTQPLDVVSAPLETEFGFHLILVTGDPPQAEVDRVTLDQILSTSRGMRVDLDPRYGTWDRENGRVVPPGA
jgi:parvulin-like peptidyl-prolyl isomerase